MDALLNFDYKFSGWNIECFCVVWFNVDLECMTVTSLFMLKKMGRRALFLWRTQMIYLKENIFI